MASPAPRVGVDVGGTKCLAVAVLEDDAIAVANDGAVAVANDGAVVAEEQRPTPGTGAELVDLVADLVAAVVGGSGVAAVGVGLPGLVDRTGTLRFAPNLPGVVDLPVAAPLTERLGVPVRCENDATCAAWGEHRMGAARGHDHVVMVTLGTGIGGGLVEGGRLVAGANGFAGELGHMVIEQHGPRCPCGRRGCWERYASGPGLARLAREAALAGRIPAVVALAGEDVEAVRGEHVTRAALDGDEAATEVLAELGAWLAAGLANVIAIVDPEIVVIGGGLVEAGDLVIEPARRALAELLIGAQHRAPVSLVPAALGPRAGAMGAALL